jgi:peptidoglycan/LPS O-acetylase OafA/YrhL
MTAGPALLGLVYYSNPFSGWPHFPWLLPYWPLFVLGMWTYWVVRSELSPLLLFLLWIVCATSAFIKMETPLLWACGTSLLIYGAFKCGALDRWLISRPFQFFGKISYSLYLIHVTVISRVLNFTFEHEPKSIPVAWTALILGLFAATGSAYLFYICVEKPSVRLSAHFKA